MCITWFIPFFPVYTCNKNSYPNHWAFLQDEEYFMTCSRCMISEVSHCVSFGRRCSVKYIWSCSDGSFASTKIGSVISLLEEQVRSMHGVNVWMGFSHHKVVWWTILNCHLEELFLLVMTSHYIRICMYPTPFQSPSDVHCLTTTGTSTMICYSSPIS